MKLAFCLFKYFPFGGLQRDFLHIVRECLLRGHTIDVYTMHWDGEIDFPLPVTVLPCKGFQNHARSNHFVKQLQPYLAKNSYDLVMGFNKMPGLDLYYAADTCFKAKAHTQRNFMYRLSPRYRHLVSFEEAVFSPHSKTKILLISKQQHIEFKNYYHTPEDRLYFLPPGIAKDRMAPANASHIRAQFRTEFNIKNEELLLLLVGSGFKTKGLDRILHGLGSLPDKLKNISKLFVLGKDHASPFERLAKKLGIDNQVTFLGGRNDVPQFLLAADLLVHPAYNESAGAILLEALAAGLPVLTTDVCGYAEHIKQSLGGMVLPSPFKQAEFNHALTYMLESPERIQWQQNAMHYAKHADIYSMPQHAVNIIEALGKS